MDVRELQDVDQAWKIETLEHGWGSTQVARLGELVDAAPLPGFVAVDGDERVGLLTYLATAGEIEVVTLEALVAGRCVGTALMTAVFRSAVPGSGHAHLLGHRRPKRQRLRLDSDLGRTNRDVQSKTDQQISLRRRWSSMTSSRISSGRRSRCHRHSPRPAASASDGAAAARAALIA